MELNMMFFTKTWHERHMREQLREIKDLGVDSICTQFSEYQPEARYLNWKVRLAHEAGLRVYAMPGRVAGLFAAGPVPNSLFTLRNPETLMRRKDGTFYIGDSGFTCCVNHPAFQEWFFKTMVRFIRESNADGICFDEPKAAYVPCYCDRCQEQVGSDDQAALIALREKSFADVLGRLAREVKALDSRMTTIAMLMPIESDHFVQACASQPALDYIGVDGPLCAQETGDLQKWKKTSLLESAPHRFALVTRMGKKTIALLETFDVYPEAHSELERNILELGTIQADMYSFNYYPHNVGSPEDVMTIVKSALSRLRVS